MLSEIIEADYLNLKYFSAITNQGMVHFFYILYNKYLLGIYSVKGTMPSITEYLKKNDPNTLSSVRLKKDVQENGFKLQNSIELKEIILFLALSSHSPVILQVVFAVHLLGIRLGFRMHI